MSIGIENKMLKKIYGNGKGWVFSAKDFTNSGSRSAVDLALHRLEHAGKIRRALRGIYYYPKFSELLGQYLSADIDHIAHAMARKFAWQIQPGEAMAQNLIGISTQVPARYLYISDGPDRTYQIDQTNLMFRHQALKDTRFKHWESGFIVQAIKSLGQNRVTPLLISKIRAWLPPALHKKVLLDTNTTAGWVYDVIKEITRENSHG